MALLKSRYAKTKEYDKPLYAEPTSTEEIFSVKAIDESGIFVLNDGKFSKCYVLSDINFAGVTDEEQKRIIINFSRVLNSISCRFSYTVANEYVDGDAFNDMIFYKKKENDLDDLRDAFNEIINDKVSDARQGLYQTIYFTLTLDADSIDEVKGLFGSVEASLSKALIQIGIDGMAGSTMEALNIDQRMQLWYNFTHSGIDSHFRFNYDRLYAAHRDWVNIVSPQSMDFYNDYFVMNGNRFGRVLFIQKHAQSLESDVISELSKINASTYFTVNSEILELSGFKQEINRKFASVGMKIESEKQRNRNNNDFLSDASDKLLSEKDALINLSRDVESGDNHYFNSTVLLMFLTNSYEEMVDVTKKIEAISGIKSFVFKPCFNKQREGINSCFMFGLQEFKRCTNFSAPCEAMYMPFKTQELNDDNGCFYGINRLSQNPIIADRKRLQNAQGVILGKAGSGKSVFAKMEILSNVCLHPEQQTIIIDPQSEYKRPASFPGVNGTIISFDSNKDIFINPMDVNFDGVDYAALQEIKSDKADFIFTLFASCIGRDIDAVEKGVLDSVVGEVYSENYAYRLRLNGEDVIQNSDFVTPRYMQKDEEEVLVSTDLSPEEQERLYSPTLQDIYQKLLDRVNDPVARSLAGHLRIFVSGSLNQFNHRTNVDLNKNFLIFDLSGIKANLRVTCMLVMLEIVRNKIRSNFAKNNWTNVYIDEFHELLYVPAVADFVIKLWKEVRKVKGCMTGITQNMTDLLNNSPDSARLAAILSNTEYFAMLNQSTIDRRMLADFLPSISPAMFNFVEGASSGTGLLKMGAVTVPFDLCMKKSSRLYKFINTDGSEGVGAI